MRKRNERNETIRKIEQLIEKYGDRPDLLEDIHEMKEAIQHSKIVSYQNPARDDFEKYFDKALYGIFLCNELREYTDDTQTAVSQDPYRKYQDNYQRQWNWYR